MFDRVKYSLILLLPCALAHCQSPSEVDSKQELEDLTLHPETKTAVDTVHYQFAWKSEYDYQTAFINQVIVPPGYQRLELPENSFGNWLRHLPLLENNTVYLFNGEEKWNQSAQYRVLDIDVGDKDLQQCADAVMRLRAEYLYATQQYDKIQFNYTNGTPIGFAKWSAGYYPSLKGNKVVWVSQASNNNSYPSFKKYMTNIFMYAGTASLEKELHSKPLNEIYPGDVFIKGGFPGHAVIVLDVAENPENGDRQFVLAQSYMPAQNIHILLNPNRNDTSPWYSLAEISGQINTPEWTFELNQLKRFEE